ncbi:CBP80/20-dependent translation initiation factor isoform X1 [Carcharodon carcharias]|uniref:CBP80/20-dependent translation initiation factor isoform X1 n=1 Tax=Carcharodon carcharias TaxID=13397 RepID=UPI001B7F2CF6|nr:CBP80/20-dependent translation initiation factor isoform X1 [Carcharodon carcharias]XP_041060294.1 CBP80/20-dependent translation initiation factor isoform X1 [Carcharodon carcharias]XP_041061148.1 CBP80/20-dependent translation initiation factor isoform X1 [Carcharodon carcharias]XP_041061901.1 CBP80/20-dependent translation initiation factor isoform X1 [Carcharodon carcharias]
MENSSVASASSEAGSNRSQEIEELERFIDSYVLEYQVQGLLTDKPETDADSEKTPPNSQWNEDFTDTLNVNWSSPKEKNSRKQINQNCNQETSYDILGTDIWAVNTFEHVSGATWDLQPEKLDFTNSFHRKHLQNASKYLPHIDREGMVKGKFEEDGNITLNDLDKVLPVRQVYQPLSNEAEIAQTKKLFRRRRNDRRYVYINQEKLTVVLPANERRSGERRQQRTPGGNKVQQQHGEHQPSHIKHNRDHSRQYQTPAPHAAGKQGPPNHGYSQQRRWQHNQRHSPNDKELNKNAKDSSNVQSEDTSHSPVQMTGEMHKPTDPPSSPTQQNLQNSEIKQRDSTSDRQVDQPKVNLLESSKDRLKRRLKEKDEISLDTTNPQKTKMDKLIEILNSMRNNSSDVDSNLTTFMEEAQNSTNSEEMLSEIVKTIYHKAVTDRSFASTAARLCDKMSLFMVEGTKFRSLLLNMLQKDFTVRDELQQTDVEHWLGFITFLCEVFGIMRSNTGEPFRVLVCPIYTCLRELLQSQDVKEDAVLCCSMELQSTGKLLEEQLPEMMTELLAAARDKMLGPSESALTRSLLLEVIELHANNWNPLTPTITQYYNKTIQKLTA